jgi:hypothetical protein
MPESGIGGDVAGALATSGPAEDLRVTSSSGSEVSATAPEGGIEGVGRIAARDGVLSPSSVTDAAEPSTELASDVVGGGGIAEREKVLSPG